MPPTSSDPYIEVIPVVDLLDGKIVHGISGQRDSYQPIVSKLTDSCDPLAVSQCFQQLGAARLYVADLDALQGGDSVSPFVAPISRLPFTEILWDAGIAVADHELLPALSKHATVCPIVALESCPGPTALANILEVTGPDRLVFSIDLMAGRSLAPSGSDWPSDSFAIARAAVELGVKRFIVLDLRQVGSNQGAVTLPLCSKIASLAPHAELISGGGIRDTSDLIGFAKAGCKACLVATALHQGKIRPHEIWSAVES